MKRITVTVALMALCLILPASGALAEKSVQQNAFQTGSFSGEGYVQGKSMGGQFDVRAQVRCGFSFIFTKGSRTLDMKCDMSKTVGKKIRGVIKELQKLGWKKEPLKTGIWKPDLILDLSEYKFSLTVQGGRADEIPLKFTATPKEIAKRINGIHVSGGVIIEQRAAE